MKFNYFFFMIVVVFDSSKEQIGDNRIYVSYDAPRTYIHYN